MEKGEQPPNQPPSQQPPPYTPAQGEPGINGLPSQSAPGYAPPMYQSAPGQPGVGQHAPSQLGYQQPGVYVQPAPAGYPAQQGAQQTNIVLVQNTVPQFRETPVPMKCTNCHADITTTTSYEVGTLAWVICAVLFLVGFGFVGLLWFCSFIPFCVPSCKDVIHRCPSCNVELGRLRRM